MLAWGFGDFKGGEIFPWRNYPLRNCPRAKFSPPLYGNLYRHCHCLQLGIGALLHMTLPEAGHESSFHKPEFDQSRLSLTLKHTRTPQKDNLWLPVVGGYFEACLSPMSEDHSPTRWRTTRHVGNNWCQMLG